ncbi:MAG: acyloxyacyl hydrolase [Bacteroidia bacterium]
MSTAKAYFRRVRLSIIAAAVMLLSLSAQAGDSTRCKKNFILSAQGHFGYSIAHHDYMAHLIKDHIYGAELNYIFRTCGKKCWQPMYKFPEFGFSGVFVYLGNPAQLGNLVALYPYTNLRLNKERRKFDLALRLGFGMAYITKPFDRITNHQNNAIGSHYNGFVNVRLSGSFMLAKAWRMDMGVGLMHASNGSMRTPNLGLNMATVNMGVGYVFGDKNLQMKCDSVMPKISKRWHSAVIGVAGVKELEHPGGSKYMAYGLMLNSYWSKNYKNRFGGGLEISYNNATRHEAIFDTISVVKNTEILQGGAKLGYVFQLDRLSFPIEFGAYFYRSKGNDDLFFHRIGLRYMMNKHFIASVTLLTHWAKADYFEFGFGYEL